MVIVDMHPIDEAYKNKIGERLADRLADALRKEEVSTDEAQKISSYILNNIETPQNSSELLDFLQKLVSIYPIFSQILTLEKAEINEKKESEVVEHAEDLIKENKIEEAIGVIGNATSQDDSQKGVI